MRSWVAQLCALPLLSGGVVCAQNAAPAPHQYHFNDITIARPSPDESQDSVFAPTRSGLYGAGCGRLDRRAAVRGGSYMVLRPLMTAERGLRRKKSGTFLWRPGGSWWWTRLRRER